MEYIINSHLTNDLYKWSMFSVELHQFPGMYVRVTFKCRSNVKLGFLKPQVDAELDHLCELRYQNYEVSAVRGLITWLAPNVIDYLRRFYLFREQIHTDVDETGQLVIWAEGPWYDVGWFEVPTLAIVEELYMRHELEKLPPAERERRMADERMLLDAKIKRLNALYERHRFTLAEFGLRRRQSAEWEDYVVRTMKNNAAFFAGTSNVELAIKHDVKPSGTMAHEIYMGIQGDERVALSHVQRRTWEAWMNEFDGNNGVLLTDIFGAKACFRDMTRVVANSFYGFRHDSGDPMVWGELLIKRLKEFGIDPMTRVAVWSDCLDVPVIEEIVDRFHDRIKISFGVGTNLVNMIPGIKPLSIVMKLTHAGTDPKNLRPVLKLSDDLGKGMCPDPSLVEYAKDVYKYEPLTMETK